MGVEGDISGKEQSFNFSLCSIQIHASAPQKHLFP